MPTTLMTSASKMTSSTAKVGYLGEATPRVDEQTQNRHVTSALEVGTFTSLEQSPEVIVRHDRHGHLGNARGLHAGHRRIGQLPFVHEV